MVSYFPILVRGSDSLVAVWFAILYLLFLQKRNRKECPLLIFAVLSIVLILYGNKLSFLYKKLVCQFSGYSFLHCSSKKWIISCTSAYGLEMRWSFATEQQTLAGGSFLKSPNWSFKVASFSFPILSVSDPNERTLFPSPSLHLGLLGNQPNMLLERILSYVMAFFHFWICNLWWLCWNKSSLLMESMIWWKHMYALISPYKFLYIFLGIIIIVINITIVVIVIVDDVVVIIVIMLGTIKVVMHLLSFCFLPLMLVFVKPT